MAKNSTPANGKEAGKHELALESLERAVACLEKAANARSAKASAELDKLRLENAALKKAGDIMAKRLDGAIIRLAAIIEG